MKEYNDIILVSLAKSARSVINNIQLTLTDLLGGVGGMLTLDNPSEDNTFMDYDGRTYMLTGIVREKMGITLCGYLMDELNGTDMETEHKVRSYCYDRIQLLNVVMAFEREIDEREEQEENEAEAARNYKMQLPLKITGNAFFRSYGSGSVFPHSDLTCAEERTSWNDLRDHADRLMYYAEDLEKAILEIDDLDELRELQKQIKEFKEK